jgi:hypothetical protein
VSSEARFAATKGQAYLIAVDGANGANGEVKLSIRYDATAVYAGILSVPEKTGTPAGSIAVSVTRDGSFTGRLALNRGSASFKGSLDAGGKATVTAKGKGVTVPVQLALDVARGTSTLTSSVMFLDDTYASVAQRSSFSRTQPTALAGNYTFLIEPASLVIGQPFGTGFASMKVEAAGRVVLAGTLGDGVRFSQTTVLADDGTFPLFAAPYRSGGSIAGGVAVGGGTRRPLSGALHWLKKPDVSRNATYPAGFEAISRLAGGSYLPATPILSLGGFGTIGFIAGNQSLPPPEQIALPSANKATTTPGGAYPLKIDVKRGLFSGSFGKGGGKRKFKGAFLQGEQRGGGVFTASGASGAVYLVPTAPAASSPPRP